MITFIKSFIIGICAILPGVSGSVIAVSLGIYDKFINYISNRRLLKSNKLFIIIVLFGLFCGVFLTGNIIIYLFKYKTIIYYSLLGVILSEIPFIIKKIHQYNNKRVELFPFIIAFIFSLVLDLLNQDNIASTYSSFNMFLGGILFSFGKVFPGISSSFFLLSLGIYDDIIILVTKPILLISNFYFYIPFIIGTIIGLLIFIKLLNYLITNKYEFTYSIILGFITSSIIILYPGFSLKTDNLIGILLMIIFFLLFIYIKAKNE